MTVCGHVVGYGRADVNGEAGKRYLLVQLGSYTVLVDPSTRQPK